jgi:hypothetical protein
LFLFSAAYSAGHVLFDGDSSVEKFSAAYSAGHNNILVVIYLKSISKNKINILTKILNSKLSLI